MTLIITQCTDNLHNSHNNYSIQIVGRTIWWVITPLGAERTRLNKDKLISKLSLVNVSHVQDFNRGPFYASACGCRVVYGFRDGPLSIRGCFDGGCLFDLHTDAGCDSRQLLQRCRHAHGRKRQLSPDLALNKRHSWGRELLGVLLGNG